MSDHLFLDFPILQPNGGDFDQSVRYLVEAENDTSIKITHFLSGESFICDLLKKGEALFSVQLLYKGEGIREEHHCSPDTGDESESVSATQIIPKSFSYAPEIIPSIVVCKEKTIRTDPSSGLSELWQSEEPIDLPSYSRIALHAKLTFTSGDISSLMTVSLDEDLKSGTMKTDINIYADEGSIPVTLHCSREIFDELRRVTDSKPKSAKEAMVSAIITQALCSVYGHMHMYRKDSNDGENPDFNSVLQAHLEQLEERTGMNWNDDDFNSSLAATIMHPYAIEALHHE